MIIETLTNLEDPPMDEIYREFRKLTIEYIWVLDLLNTNLS
jgi:hypothetical protein